MRLIFLFFKVLLVIFNQLFLINLFNFFLLLLTLVFLGVIILLRIERFGLGRRQVLLGLLLGLLDLFRVIFLVILLS